MKKCGLMGAACLLAAGLVLTGVPGSTLAQTAAIDVKKADSTQVFRVNDDGGFVAFGPTDRHDLLGGIPTSGPGARMMWYAGKAAFRAGLTEGTEWDDDHIGLMSTALGFNTSARGFASTALGYLATAAGTADVALGQQVTASGGASVAIGVSSQATGQQAIAIAGGRASGHAAVAIGNGTVASGDASIAMGLSANTNGMRGSFVWADGANMALNAPAANTFTVRAIAGTYFYSNWQLSSGVKLNASASAWSTVSDRNRKRDFWDEDGEEVLAKIAEMPIQSWSYKAEDPSIRHLGPVAQDFYAAFGLGYDDLTITTQDIDGVNLLAVQALDARTRTLPQQLEDAERRIERLEGLVEQLLAQRLREEGGHSR